MTLRIFVSYSHKDEATFERLRVHLAMLKREGVVSTWDDKEIHAGQKLDTAIADAHDESSLFMPIVSPDFLASEYCYDVEMNTALEKANRGLMTIIPVIAEPCDWLSSPLSVFKGVPKDGKPISEWANANNAYLDVVQELRRLAKGVTQGIQATKTVQIRNATPRLKIRKDFSSIDRARFRDAAYTEIEKYFRESISEFSQIDGVQGAFEEIDGNAFTCTVVNQARRNSESHLTVRNSKDRHSLGDIVISFEPHARPGTANEIVTVTSDDYDQFLEFGMRLGHSGDEVRLSAAQVADSLWRDFIRRAGIEYE